MGGIKTLPRRCMCGRAFGFEDSNGTILSYCPCGRVTEASHWCIVCGGTGRGELPEPQLTIAELYEATETVEERYERFHPPCVMCGGAGAMA